MIIFAQANNEIVEEGLELAKKYGPELVSKLKPKDDKANAEQEFLTVATAVNRLANLLLGMGVSNTNYTDPKLLEQQFSNVKFSDIPDYVNSLYDFMNSVVPILKSHDPNIANIAFDWAMKLYKKKGYDISSVKSELSELSQRVVTEDLYVMSVLKENFTLAATLQLLESMGDKDRDAYAKMLKIVSLSNDMFGPSSKKLIDIHSLMDEKIKARFNQYEMDYGKYELMMPIAIEKQKALQGWYKGFEKIYGSQLAKGIVSTPMVRDFILWNTLWHDALMNGPLPGFKSPFKGVQ